MILAPQKDKTKFNLWFLIFFHITAEDSLKAIRKEDMTDLHQVKCVNKSDRSNPHERILSIGGTNPNGTPWKLPLQDAISGIESGKWQFYVSVGGKSVWVVIAKSAQGHKYLKTDADGEYTNNLLNLTECSR